MAVFSADRPCTPGRAALLAPLLIAAALSAAPAAAAHAAAARAAAAQAITLDAQSADYANNNVLFRKIRISRGSMSIAADQGQGLAQGKGAKQGAPLDFDDSLWVFRGNVKITIEQGEVTADDAEINFSKQQLAKAVANGKPAAFEDRIEKTGKTAHGRADTIDYDAAKGVVRLSKNAWLSNGDTEIRGESIKYNMLAQTFAAEGAEQDSHQVHIVIPPPPPKP
jgi:lipopolysaccharide export system protein LptA